jgi:cyanophycin synthetase
MRLDLEEMEQFPTNKIDGFKERIEAMLPTRLNTVVQKVVEGIFFQSGTRYLDGACN